jgi:hypothetical protein
MKTKDTKITLNFRENEMKHIEGMMIKYFGRKIKNQKQLKSDLGMFISIMFSKGMYAVEEDKEWMEVA